MKVETATLYVHATCSKSAEALEHIRRLGDALDIEVTVRDYVSTPLSVAELGSLLATLEADPVELVRSWGDRDPASVTADDVVDHLLAQPGDMQRPILRLGSRTIIARPPSLVIDALLDRAVADSA